MELTLPTRLRPLIAKHWSHVVDLVRLVVFRAVQLVFNIGPDHAGRTFWAQCHVTIALVFKVIHFFGNDIRSLTSRAGKNIVVFKNWRANFTVAIARKDFTSQFLNGFPLSGFARQDISRAFWALIAHCISPPLINQSI